MYEKLIGKRVHVLYDRAGKPWIAAGALHQYDQELQMLCVNDEKTGKDLYIGAQHIIELRIEESPLYEDEEDEDE
jgi:hypothetical protein